MRAFPPSISSVNRTPAEHVAERTWLTLERADSLRVRFGEETLTDLLVLDMIPHRRAKGFWLAPTTKRAENKCGADLLIVIRHRTGLCSWVTLQAKKLYPEDLYRTLNGGGKCLSQLNTLECFSRQLNALPLYLLYNHSNSAQKPQHWHCARPFDVAQLGCTLVPSWHIRRMLSRRPLARSFHDAHEVDQSRPWRCAFDCTAGNGCRDADAALAAMAFRTERANHNMPPIPQYDWTFDQREGAWPERLFHAETTELTTDDVDQILSEVHGMDFRATRDRPRCVGKPDESRLYPARLLIVDQSE